jgi:L-serine dehydratase
VPYLTTIAIIVKTSLFEIFQIDIGPSSSHTVRPMLAAGEFVSDLGRKGWC